MQGGQRVYDRSRDLWRARCRLSQASAGGRMHNAVCILAGAVIRTGVDLAAAAERVLLLLLVLAVLLPLLLLFLLFFLLFFLLSLSRATIGRHVVVD
jgi:hypothetical protein